MSIFRRGQPDKIWFRAGLAELLLKACSRYDPLGRAAQRANGDGPLVAISPSRDRRSHVHSLWFPPALQRWFLSSRSGSAVDQLVEAPQHVAVDASLGSVNVTLENHSDLLRSAFGEGPGSHCTGLKPYTGKWRIEFSRTRDCRRSL